MKEEARADELAHWQAYQTDEAVGGHWYFHNHQTGETLWADELAGEEREGLMPPIPQGLSMNESVRRLEAAFKAVSSDENQRHLKELEQLKQQLEEATRSRTPSLSDNLLGSPSSSAASDLQGSRRLLARLDQQGRRYQEQISQLNSTLQHSRDTIHENHLSFQQLETSLKLLQNRCEAMEDEKVFAREREQMAAEDSASRDLELIYRDAILSAMLFVAAGAKQPYSFMTDGGNLSDWLVPEERAEHYMTHKPVQHKWPESFKVEECACIQMGANHSVMQSSTGRLYEWGFVAGAMSLCPRQVAIGVRVRRVACGMYHTVALGVDYDVYTWGAGNCGQLGHGNDQDSKIPRRVEVLEQKKVAVVGCGYYHTVVACKVGGQVYSWGLGKDGQLAQGGDPKNQWLPGLVKGLPGLMITSLAAGLTHTLAATKEGSVYSWGTGQHGELGLGAGCSYSALPQCVSGELDDYVALSVSCGLHHSLVLGQTACWKEVQTTTRPRNGLHGSGTIQVHDQAGVSLLFCFGGDGDGGVHPGMQVIRLDEEGELRWIEPLTKGQAASSRVYHTCTLVGSLVIVWGGLNTDHAVVPSEVYVFDIQTMQWHCAATTGQTPISRAMHTATAMGTSLVTFGGSALATGLPFADLGILDTSNGEPFQWTSCPQQGDNWPAARERHSADAIGEEIYVFGGFDGTDFLADLWKLNSSLEWSLVNTSGGNLLTPRSDHSTTLLDKGSSLVVLGGFDGKHYLNDFWVLDLDLKQWSAPQVMYDSMPAPRGCASIAMTTSSSGSTELYIIGGWDGVKHKTDVWKLQMNQNHLFACGDNTHKQLGLSSDQSQQWVPGRVNSLDCANTKSISCGQHHCAAVTKNGKVFTWGLEKYGQLGTTNQVFGEVTANSGPVDVTPVGQHMKNLGCGMFSTQCGDAFGDLWSWGWSGPTVHGRGSSTNANLVKTAIASLQRVARGLLGRKKVQAVRSMQQSDREAWAATLIQRTYRDNKGQIAINVMQRSKVMETLEAARLQAERLGQPEPKEVREARERKERKERALEASRKRALDNNQDSIEVDLASQAAPGASKAEGWSGKREEREQARVEKQRRETEALAEAVLKERQLAEQIRSEAEQALAEANQMKAEAANQLKGKSKPAGALRRQSSTSATSEGSSSAVAKARQLKEEAEQLRAEAAQEKAEAQKERLRVEKELQQMRAETCREKARLDRLKAEAEMLDSSDRNSSTRFSPRTSQIQEGLNDTLDPPQSDAAMRTAGLHTKLAKREQELRDALEKVTRLQEHAVVRIQKAARGRAARKHKASQRVVYHADEQARAAVRIQSAARGRAVRNQQKTTPARSPRSPKFIQREWWMTNKHPASNHPVLLAMFASSGLLPTRISNNSPKKKFRRPIRRIVTLPASQADKEESAARLIQARWRGAVARSSIQQLLWLLAEETLALKHKIATERHERSHRAVQRKKRGQITQNSLRRSMQTSGAYHAGTARGYGGQHSPSNRNQAWAQTARTHDAGAPLFMDFGHCMSPQQCRSLPAAEGSSISSVYNVRREDVRFHQLTPLSERLAETSSSPKVDSKYATLPRINGQRSYRRMYTVVIMNVGQNAARVFKLLQKQSWLFKDNIHATSASDENLEIGHHDCFEWAQHQMQGIMGAGRQPQPKSNGPTKHRPYSWEGKRAGRILLHNESNGADFALGTQTGFSTPNSDIAPRPPSSPKPPSAGRSSPHTARAY